MDNQKQIENYRILASNALDGGDGREALVYYNKILEIEPTTVDAWAGKCTAQAFLGTLDSPEVATMLSAAKSAVRHSKPEHQPTIKIQMARLLINYCEQMVKGGNKSSIEEKEDSKDQGFFAGIAAFMTAEMRRCWRVRQIYPIVDLAVDFANKDPQVLRQAIGMIDLGLEIFLPTNDRDREEEAAAKDFSARVIALMRQVEPGFQHVPRKWDVARPVAQSATCFPPDARVLTPFGWRRIESLMPGDEVMSWSQGALVTRVIEKKKAHGFCPILEVEFVGCEGPLRATPNHKVLSTENRWVRVDALSAGSSVLGMNGPMVVASVRRASDLEQVYNLITSVDRNFIVEGVVAHSYGLLLELRMLLDRCAGLLRAPSAAQGQCGSLGAV